MRTSLIERRVGTKEKAPKCVALKAGPLSVEFVAGNLRAIRYEGHEVLRAIAYVVRNADWGTFNPEISDCLIRKNSKSFTVTYRARCVSADSTQMLDYQARITGDTQGDLVFEVLAQPLTPFRTARCGFAVLHPIEGVAGQPAVVEHVDGSQEQTNFPELICPRSRSKTFAPSSTR